MSNTILRIIRVIALLLVVSIIAAACSPKVSVDEAIAQTVAARDAVELQVQQTVDAALAAQEVAQPPVDTVDPQVQQTVDAVLAAQAATQQASDAVALQVQQTVDAALATQGVDNGGLDIADPAAGIEPIKPVADPNLASGTPQLRVNASSVNVRSGPGTNYPVISTLLKDSVITAIAKNRDGSWFLIELPGGARGWIANSVTDAVVEADMVNVAVAATIPAPPPTAIPTATSTRMANTPTPTSTATRVPGATHTATPTSAATNTATPTSAATNTATPFAATSTATPIPAATSTETPPPTDTPEPIPATIVVINDTATDICFLFIDLSTDPWTIDRLGNDILPPGFQISFSFPEGQYDFMAQDCSQNVIATLFQTFVSGTFTWDIQ